MAKVNRRAPIEIAGIQVKPGSRQSIGIALPSFCTHSSVNMPVHAVHGHRAGLVLLVTAAILRDEIIGAEIIRCLLVYPPWLGMKWARLRSDFSELIGQMD